MLQELSDRVIGNAKYKILILSASAVLVFNTACALKGLTDFDISQAYRPQIVRQYSEEELRILRENAQLEPRTYADYLFS